MNRLIGASAGSGKTHALTTQYLRLLRERHRTVEDREGGDPLGVASLLAATFTRKAAGEIFDRLLTRLAAAALHADGLASLQAALDDPSLTTDHCRALLSGLCRSLHRVRIGTLDSFFGRLVRLYHREAGLCAHARLTYSQDPRCRALAREALRATLDTLGGRGEVAALFQALRRQEAPATVWPDLLDLLQDIAEDVHGASPEHWERLPVPPTPSQAEIDAALSALDAYTPTDKRWSNAVRGDLENFREGDWEKFLAAGLAKACLDVTPQYYGKPVPGAVVAAYAVLVGVARHVLLTELREQTLAIRALHHEFSTRYAALRRVEGLVLFSETPLLLKDAVGDGADAAGRLGASLEHLLLDEFQDTGDAQWGLLRGFALRASRAPGSVFVVADAKQALYAWRGGRAELFGCLEREIAPASRETLGRSYRSSAVVLAVVNAVFRTLAGNETLAGHAETAARWAAHGEEHQAAKTLPGFVEFCVSPVPPAGTPGDDADGSETSGHLARCAARMAAEIGRLPPGTSVGVLVRSNRALARMTDLLRAQGVPAGGEGVGGIADDPAVEVILSALTLADHPGHTAAAYHVAHSPLGALLGLRPGDCADARAVSAVAVTVRRQVLDDGYADVLCRWALTLAPHGLERTARRLEQLVELASELDALPPMCPAEFVRAVRESEAEMPGRAPVRVMTIHRAKGLEFDAVFLPDLDWKIQPSAKPCLVERADIAEIAAGASPVRAVHARPGKVHQRLCPDLQRLADRAEADEVTGMLCLLYVAMTRARHALHLYVAPHTLKKDGTPEKPGLKPSAILRAALCGSAAHPDQGDDWRTLSQVGEPAWFLQVPPLPALVPVTSPARPSLRFRASDGLRPGSLPAEAVREAPRMAADLLGLN